MLVKVPIRAGADCKLKPEFVQLCTRSLSSLEIGGRSRSPKVRNSPASKGGKGEAPMRRAAPPKGTDENARIKYDRNHVLRPA